MQDVETSLSTPFVAPVSLLAPPDDGVFDSFAHLTALALHADVALVDLVDGWGIWNARNDRAKLSTSIAIRNAGPGPLPMATERYRLADPVFAQENGFPFYASVPLRADEIGLGRLVIVSRLPRDASTDDVALLRGIAGVIVESLGLRASACRQLREAASGS